MSITTGKFFTNLLLAATPTVLGRALNQNPTTIAQWITALSATKDKEDAGVLATYKGILSDAANSGLLKALLTPVTYQGSQVPVGQVIVGLLFAVGSTPGVLKATWSDPPHPRGTTDINNLIAALAPYDETA